MKRGDHFDQVSDDIIEVLDHRHSIIHFRISLGTIVIQTLTKRHPERVKSMVLGGAVVDSIPHEIFNELGISLNISCHIFGFIVFSLGLLCQSHPTRNPETLLFDKPKSCANGNFCVGFD